MLLIIANPIAGGGRATRAAQDICRYLDESALPYEICYTDFAGQATSIAQKAALRPDCEGIISVGGDGTLNEIVGGLLEHPLPLIIAPCGTGNDFARALRLPTDPVEAVRRQLHGESCPLDMGRVNRRAFLNVAGAGFDVEVLRQTQRFKHVGRGLMPYLLGVCAALRHFKPLKATLTLEDGTEIKQAFTIIAFANGQYFGGGMKVAPMACPTDGYLDVVAVRSVPKWGIALLLPTFITGAFTRIPSLAKIYRCRRIHLYSPEMTVNVDGELIDLDSAEICLLPGHLPAFARQNCAARSEQTAS